MLLFLLCAAANDDYVALKAFYESTGGSGWACNANWDMSNTDVCAALALAGSAANDDYVEALKAFYESTGGGTAVRTPFAASSTSMEGRSSTRLIPRTAKRGRPGALAYRPLTKIYRPAPAGLGTGSTRASGRNAEFYSASCGHRLSSFLDANTPSNHAEKFASIALSTSGRACGPIAKSWRSPRSASRS